MRGRSIHELNRDYVDADRLAERFGLEDEVRARLVAYRRFIERNGYRIGPCPASLRAVALAEPADSSVRQDVLTEVEARIWKASQPWFRCLHVPPSDPNPALSRTIDTGAVVQAVAYLERHGRPHALAGCGDGVVRLYDLTTGENVQEYCGHAGGVNAVALAADGRHALSGSDDKTLRWWDLHTGQSRVLDGHTSKVRAVALTADGRHALSASRDNTLRWWDLDTGQSRVLERHTNWVNAVALAADGRHALSGSLDRTLRWWDLETARCLAVFPCEAPVTAAALAFDAAVGKPVVAAGLANGQVQFFHIEHA